MITIIFRDSMLPHPFFSKHTIDLLVTHVQILHFMNKIFVISRLITKFIVPQNLELYGILLLIYCPHRLPHSSTIQIHMYCFHTEYYYRTLWTNLAVSLSTHFAVFLQLCFVNSALPHCIQPFLGWETGHFPVIFSFLGTRLIISAGQKLLACRIL